MEISCASIRCHLMAAILQANEAPPSDPANLEPSNSIFDVDKGWAPIKVLSKLMPDRAIGHRVNFLLMSNANDSRTETPRLG